MRANRVSITNDVGGTEVLPEGDYEVIVTRSWNDHEIGRRYAGRLVKPEDVETARKAGTTGFKPKDYEKYLEKDPEIVARTSLAAKRFDPAVCYWGQFDLIEEAS